MEIKFRRTEEDFIMYNLHYCKNSPLMKKRYNILKYLSLFIFIIIFRFFYVVTKSINIELKYIPIIIIIFMSIMIVYVWIIKGSKEYEKSVINTSKKLSKNVENSYFFDEQTLSIVENNIKLSNEFGFIILSEKNIKYVSVYDDMIVVNLSEIAAHVIPTRYLDEENKKYIINRLTSAHNT